MSRAANILTWVQSVDEGDPVAFTLDHNPQFQLNQTPPYNYQGRGPGDAIGNSRMGDGTKPAGMMVNNDPTAQGRMNTQMSPQDMQLMDVRP